MPKITDTYTLAYDCCETILRELNRFPTIDLIRERIGVNSPTTIKKAMNNWTAEFAKRYIEQQQPEINCPEVPNILTAAVIQLWKHTVKEAEQNANGQVMVLNTKTTELQELVIQLQGELGEAKQAQKQTALDLKRAEDSLETLTQDYQKLQKNLQTAEEKEQLLIKALEAQEKQETKLVKQHEQRLQQEQAWMQRRIMEEKELAEDKWRGKYQQLEEQLAFLKAQVGQKQQTQQIMHEQNKQLIEENTKLKANQIEAW